MMDTKHASLSLMIGPGSRDVSQEFAHGASDVGRIEIVAGIYNQKVGLYCIGNRTQQTKGLITQSDRRSWKDGNRFAKGLGGAVQSVPRHRRLRDGTHGYFLLCPLRRGYRLVHNPLRTNQIKAHRANDKRRAGAKNTGFD